MWKNVMCSVFCHLHACNKIWSDITAANMGTVWTACICVCVGVYTYVCVGVYTYEYCRLSLRHVTALSSLTGTWLLSPMLRFGLCILAVNLFFPCPSQSFTTNLILFCDNNFLPAFPCPAFWFKWLLAQPTHCLYIKMETRCHPGLNDTKLFHLLHVFYSKQTWYVKVWCIFPFLCRWYPDLSAYKKKRSFSY